MVDLRLQAGYAGLVAVVAAWLNHGTPSGPFSLASPVRPSKGPSQIYLVQLNEAAALNYRGTKAGDATRSWPQAGPAFGGRRELRRLPGGLSRSAAGRRRRAQFQAV